LHDVTATPRAKGAQPFDLLALRRRIDPQDPFHSAAGERAVLGFGELVHAHDELLAGLDPP
jgi:hypothetical protein